MQPERTLFFTKPYIPVTIAEDILHYLDPTLLMQQEKYFPEQTPVPYSVDERFLFSNLSLSQWQEFYDPIRPDFPKIHEEMCADFASSPGGILGIVISGDTQKNERGIIEVVRDCLGHRILERNPNWTIRGKFGKINQDEKSHRTVAHASTRDQVARDLEIFRKWRIIH